MDMSVLSKNRAGMAPRLPVTLLGLLSADFGGRGWGWGWGVRGGGGVGGGGGRVGTTEVLYDAFLSCGHLGK